MPTSLPTRRIETAPGPSSVRIRSATSLICSAVVRVPVDIPVTYTSYRGSRKAKLYAVYLKPSATLAGRASTSLPERQVVIIDLPIRGLLAVDGQDVPSSCSISLQLN